mgnify:CR=1 FL=1
MAYCSRSDLEAAHGALKIEQWSEGDTARVDRAIADAEAEVDGYLLSGGYPVPLSPAPDNIRKYTTDLAVYNLLTAVGVSGQAEGDQVYIDRAKAARRYLEKVAEGKFRIPGYAEDGEVSAPRVGGVKVSARDRLDMEGY